MIRPAAALAAALVGSLAIASVAHADGGARRNADRVAAQDDDSEQFVILNASTKLGDFGSIDRVRRVLDARGLLAPLSENLAARLDGRAVLIAEIDAIRDAFMNLDYRAAHKIIDANEERILGGAGSGDPIPALAQLCEFRGLIASAQQDRDEAVRQFRAAIRLNPAWSPDRKLGSSPSVRKLVKKARREAEDTGRLRIDSDLEDAMLQVDGRKPRPLGKTMTLPVGIHLLVISAEGYTSYAELVDIRADQAERFSIMLDKATREDRAARIVDATVSAAPGKARLNKVRRLARYTNQTRYLVLEGGDAETTRFRLYDIDAIKVSRPIELDGNESSAEITAKLMAALDPDNLVDPTSVMIIERQRGQRWYERWYVWVGLGAALGGGALGYHYMSREPTAVRF